MQWKKKIRNVETTICNAVHPLELIGKADLQVAIIFSSHNDHVRLAPEWVSHQVYLEEKCKARDMTLRDHFSVVWIIRRNLIRTTIPPPTTIKYKSRWSSSIYALCFQKPLVEIWSNFCCSKRLKCRFLLVREAPGALSAEAQGYNCGFVRTVWTGST